MKKAAAACICIAAVAAGAIIGTVMAGGLGGSSSGGSSANTGTSSDETEGNVPKQTIGNTISWQGKSYTLNNDLKNVLIIGVDKKEAFEKSYEPCYAGQCDFLVLLSVDEETGVGKILEIHRNTMTPVDHFDEDGQITYTATEQIALQYAYDIGGEASCRATLQTVEDLLYGIEIDDYFTISAGGITELVDAFGGVDVTISDDYTEIDPVFVKGTTIHMDGTLAKEYIQSRDTTEFDSASDRMNRQTDFICGFTSAVGTKSTGSLYDIYQKYNGTYLLTDMTAETMKKFGTYTYDADNILTIPGQTIMGDNGLEEYHADEDALQQLVIENFYTPAEE